MSNNPFQLIIPLRQHTPIIHFQHQQDGATLRATEVKPKLDKYLIKNAFGAEKRAYERFLVGSANSDHAALDYKMRIITEKSNRDICLPIRKKDRDNSVPMFFANMGDDYEERGLVFREHTELYIHCFHPELKNIIGSHIASFFAITNFGMRSTKGFGSFTVEGDTTVPTQAFRFSVNSKDWNIVFRTMDLFYKSIRGGINGAIKPSDGRYVKGFYMKPMIFQYALDQEVKWEKKIIKEQRAFHGQVEGQRNDPKNDKNNPRDWPLWASPPKPRIVRDLLGLSTDQTWKGYPGGKNGATITKEHNEGQIERFASPIVFKPIQTNNGFDVFFWANPIPKEYLDAAFKIEVNGQSIGSTPMWKEFDIQHFLREYVRTNRLNAAMHLDSGNRDHDLIAGLLRRIYSEIENNHSK
jgi:hypothetical protein